MQKICIVLLIAGAVFPVLTKQQNYIFKFGILEKSKKGGYHVATETSILPLKLRNSGFRYGVSVNNIPKGSHNIYFKLYLPKPPKHYTGHASISNKQALGKAVVAPKTRLEEDWTAECWFDEGDPPGEWKMEIFIDDKLLRTINFTVRDE